MSILEKVGTFLGSIYECARFRTPFSLQYLIPAHISNKTNELKIVGIMALIMLKTHYCVQSSTDRTDIVLASPRGPASLREKKTASFHLDSSGRNTPGLPIRFEELCKSKWGDLP